MFASVVCVNFANETRWYTNQEMCTVDSCQLFNVFIRKGMVMSGINHVRTGIKTVALFVEKRRQTRQGMSPGVANTLWWHNVPFFRVCKLCNLIH